MKDKNFNNQVNIDLSEDNPETPRYDRHITPAETAARQEREGEQFLHTPSREQGQDLENNSQDLTDTINTTEGYTVDKEGLLNNYAIEPEMYVNTPGDLSESEESDRNQRAHELQDLKENNKDQKLGLTQDSRGRGPGII